MAKWNLDAAVQHLVVNAHSQPIRRCAQYVREAIEAGGVTLVRRNSAKDYGPSLTAVGFLEVAEQAPLRELKGDVVVMQAIGEHVHGHMQMYSGTQWISDYKQNGFWPYIRSRPEYKLYRFPSPSTSTPLPPLPVFNYGVPGTYRPSISYGSAPDDDSNGTISGAPGGSSSGSPSGSSSGNTMSGSLGGVTAYPGTPIMQGMIGPNIEAVQTRLKQLGWTLVPDGIFGNYTKGAVVSFQRTVSLTDDGIVGPNTWNALFN